MRLNTASIIGSGLILTGVSLIGRSAIVNTSYGVATGVCLLGAGLYELLRYRRR